MIVFEKFQQIISQETVLLNQKFEVYSYDSFKSYLIKSIINILAKLRSLI